VSWSLENSLQTRTHTAKLRHSTTAAKMVDGTMGACTCLGCVIAIATLPTLVKYREVPLIP
jgi:hypothetical protein